MDEFDKSQMRSVYALVSVMLLVAAIAGVSVFGPEPSAGGAYPTSSFIGTTPDAATVEPQPPTF